MPETIISPHVLEHPRQLLIASTSVLTLHADLEHLDLLISLAQALLRWRLTGEAKMALAAPAMEPAKDTCLIDRSG
jgi:hypothetical protein